MLANEEVIDGKSERGDHPVERVPLRQWMLKITAYADRLDADLEALDWPDTQGEAAPLDRPQRGRRGRLRRRRRRGATIRVFTTRADTLPGVTYVVLAPEHPLVEKLVAKEQQAEVRAYVEAARNKSDRDRAEAKTKTGVPLGRDAP